MEAGLYIHIPYCKKKCNYCDFYSCGDCEAVPQEYVAAVIREIQAYTQLKCKKWKTYLHNTIKYLVSIKLIYQCSLVRLKLLMILMVY